uniref:ATP synthase F0 subunit 8 n=1 Tax=Hemicentrus obliquus TaxID=3065208 RepID=A0AA95NM01_9HEMI|nr:ATP synthase F0 subunit 8 [Hemicentrus obliquus]WKZ08035.1 ATP synthase F0 subunit 8 [Hemicentrus obliquus]
MPQMSPLWWLTLMLSFNLMIAMAMSMMYFNFSMIMSKKYKSMKKEMNWKW